MHRVRALYRLCIWHKCTRAERAQFKRAGLAPAVIFLAICRINLRLAKHGSIAGEIHFERTRKLEALTTSAGAMISAFTRIGLFPCASANASAAAFSPIRRLSWSILESGTRRKSE